KAQSVNDSDVRARFNLAWVYQGEKNYAAALRVLAEAVILDKTGQYRDRVVQKHGELLGHLTRRHQQEYLLLINLVSKFAATPPDQQATEPKQDEATAVPL